MHFVPPVQSAGWTAVVITTLSQSVALSLLLAGRAVPAACIAVLGNALLAILLVVYGDRAIRMTRRIAELEADLQAANTDPVTGLAVRRVAERRIFDAVGAAVTVALIDVDGMHDINSVHTHDGGDRYLAELAARLLRAAEPGDLVARLGGDEFVLVTQRDPQTLASSLAAAVAPPVTLDGVTRPMHVSVGICRTGGGDPHSALGRADRAMYTAKRRRSGIEHYEPLRDGTPLPHGVRPLDRPARPAGRTTPCSNG
jgi:diguanylate cyclase (GGDEF)-like protein